MKSRISKDPTLRLLAATFLTKVERNVKGEDTTKHPTVQNYEEKYPSVSLFLVMDYNGILGNHLEHT